MKRINWNFPIFSAALLLSPVLVWGNAATILDCGTGPSYVNNDGSPRSCAQVLNDTGSGTATINGYVDGGTLYFGSYLSIEATNFKLPPPPVEDPISEWWNPLAQAGWQETITFLSGPGTGHWGELELIYSVSGKVSGNIPIKGVMRITGQPLSNGRTDDSYMYWFAPEAPDDVLFTKRIPFFFDTPQLYGAWIRSDLLLSRLDTNWTGAAYADFADTAALMGVHVFGEDGKDITHEVSMRTASGDTNPFGLNNGTPIPEPATLALVGLGLAGLGFSRRKQ
jgi:hypothetical protein